MKTLAKDFVFAVGP